VHGATVKAVKVLFKHCERNQRYPLMRVGWDTGWVWSWLWTKKNYLVLPDRNYNCPVAKFEPLYRGADNFLARGTFRCILFDGENISFDASLVI
jgi:hypothetical protein